MSQLERAEEGYRVSEATQAEPGPTPAEKPIRLETTSDARSNSRLQDASTSNRTVKTVVLLEASLDRFVSVAVV